MRLVRRIRIRRRLLASTLAVMLLLVASRSEAVAQLTPEEQYAAFFGLLILGALFGAVMQMWAEFKPYANWRQAVGMCGVKVFVAVNVALLGYELFSLHLPALLGISMLASVGGGIALDRLSTAALKVVMREIDPAAGGSGGPPR
jgi:hypothetical protein